MILLWISIPELHSVHRAHSPNFVRMRYSFKSYYASGQACGQTDGHIDGFFFYFFWVIRHKKHRHSLKGDIFFNDAIKILSLFTYSVCDEKVKTKVK